ncbi:hypothetical protein AAFC00_004711 [Neodothiora populina]
MLYSATSSTTTVSSNRYTLDDTDEDDTSPCRPPKRRRLEEKQVVSTGWDAVDEKLNGGLVYGLGGVCCVSGEGRLVELFSQRLLVSHLLSSNRNIHHRRDDPSTAAPAPAATAKVGGAGEEEDASSATVIDSQGHFSVRRLYEDIKTGLIHDKKNASTSSSKTGNAKADADTEAEAARILERVDIMTVFDIEGMLEGVAEMKQRFNDDEAAAAAATVEKAHEQEAEPIKSTIADSQDEGLDGMLVFVEPEAGVLDAAAAAAAVVESLPLDPETKSGDEKENENSKIEGSGQPRRLLTIDNFAHLITPVIKNNYVQGQALLTSILRSLSHTARRYNMCIVLLNSAVNYKGDQDCPSAFSSIVTRPSLGRTLDYMVDTHLFVNEMAAGQVRDGASKSRMQAVGVVEVLQDRYDDRTGRVGLFTLLM